MLVGAAVAVPAAGGASAMSGAASPCHARRRAKTGDGSGPDGSEAGHLFAVDFGVLREIRPGALGVRFFFGAAVSVVAGLVGVVAGQRAGGVMLAAPPLAATPTIIEKDEGRGPAATEVQGAVPGAVALTGFAVVAAASTAKLPLAAALLCALAAWVLVAIGGYLAQAAILPVWRQDVGDQAFQRRRRPGRRPPPHTCRLDRLRAELLAAELIAPGLIGPS